MVLEPDLDTPTGILAAIQQCGLTLTAHKGRCHLTPPGPLSAPLRRAIALHKTRLLAYLEPPHKTESLAHAKENLLPLPMEPPSLPNGLTHYHSSVVDGELWVAETPAAAAATPNGGVVYLACEIHQLRDMKAHNPGTFPNKLRALHQLKITFGITIIAVENTPDVPLTHAIPMGQPCACSTCGSTRRWRSIYGAVVCVQCHPPADAALVTGWEGT